ncbi:chloride channel protein [Curvibacter sp. CHRR-16]|uniref:chloride channel protein n=1 Tax=Curvibacter sp. CHRR-16 TaxID=2835872 RepID=UPI001BD9F958|nr:chloride channel protein [Curvibacter sp. CHRR-16]MBT0570782.1 chloride channel protein [Curvibacter sp. CHRR-16]
MRKRSHPHIYSAVRYELRSTTVWRTRLVVLSFAALAGFAVVGLAWLAELALAWFFAMQQRWGWFALGWTPLCTGLIVWATRRWAVGAAGSGIPQVMAAQEVDDEQGRSLFVSLRLSVAKVLLTAWGLLAGLSLGREGPSVQVAAGIMHAARRWLPRRSRITAQHLLVAGGAAGIAAAFNTPLGGIMFALEELGRHSDSKHHALSMAAIVLAGLIGVSVYGNASYFGVIHVQHWRWDAVAPALVVTLVAGVLGGIFSRLLVVSLAAGAPLGRVLQWRAAHPVAFAALCGLAVAVIGVVTQGATFGSGYAYTKAALDGAGQSHWLYVPLKFVSTWLTAWSGVPGGIFAPSLAIGGAVGHDVAHYWAVYGVYVDAPTLIALGMVGFLAAATQAPLTAFIIVMEMVDGHALVLSLMACAMVASGISRLISAPLYPSLADAQLLRWTPSKP